MEAAIFGTAATGGFDGLQTGTGLVEPAAAFGGVGFGGAGGGGVEQGVVLLDGEVEAFLLLIDAANLVGVHGGGIGVLLGVESVEGGAIVRVGEFVAGGVVGGGDAEAVAQTAMGLADPGSFRGVADEAGEELCGLAEAGELDEGLGLEKAGVGEDFGLGRGLGKGGDQLDGVGVVAGLVGGAGGEETRIRHARIFGPAVGKGLEALGGGFIFPAIEVALGEPQNHVRNARGVGIVGEIGLGEGTRLVVFAEVIVAKDEEEAGLGSGNPRRPQERRSRHAHAPVGSDRQ